MLILPPEPPEVELRHRRARAALVGAVVLMAAALVLWGVSASKLQHTRAALEAEAPPPPAAAAAPLALGLGAGQEPTATEVMAFLATQARELGVQWVSVTIAEAADAAITAPGGAQLESWHASIALKGNYRGVKRWMREASGRYPQLVWTAGRWTRAAGAGQSGAKTPAGMAQQPTEGQLEVQLQLAWLKAAPNTKLTATSPDFRGP